MPLNWCYRNKKQIFHFLILLGSGFACQQKNELREETIIRKPLELSKEELYDRILGSLVGGAIGDAMGAPTEMWSREAIQGTFGFVSSLDSMIRETSPEGIWIANLPAGGSTDDTRWKMLTADYLTKQKSDALAPQLFAKSIIEKYESFIEDFDQLKDNSPEGYEETMMKANWLSEWYKVAVPFVQADYLAYSDSLSKFYGGEMVCAGLLYAPTLGLFYPGDPELAYQQAYKLSIFDLGYARDLTALSAAMTAAGMNKNASSDSLLASIRIDTEGYFQSRLVGRSAFKLFEQAKWIANEAKKQDSTPDRLALSSPALNFAFQQLDLKQQDMPFHAGEIYLQTLTAMLFADFDFKSTLIFLVNYGRDNDTTAALAGSILGAWKGFNQLPEEERAIALRTNHELLGIDLEAMAAQLTDHIWELSLGK